MRAAYLELENTVNIEQEILHHPAWYGKIAGLRAEKSLRGRAPYVYLIREGEYLLHYYVSFVLPDMSIRHQPFVITIDQGQWFCENGGCTGPFMKETINDMIHLIMHCKPNEAKPLVGFEFA